MHLLPVVLVGLVLGMRHLPQLAMDLRNLPRRVITRTRTRVPMPAIALLWLLIIVEMFQRLVGKGIAHPAGIVLVFGGCLIGSWALYTLGSCYSEEIVIFSDSQLVTQGIYSIVRHPMRLGLLVETLGGAILADTVECYVAWTLLAVAFTVRSWDEEAVLSATYGEKARRYMADVPAFNAFRGLWGAQRRRRGARRTCRRQPSQAGS